MAFLAMIMFVVMVVFGHDFVGWEDPAGKVQLALFLAFVLGIICGYRVPAER
ncbi:MAG: hypothetical protein H7X93_09220 [Sphingomonadaceae bacterium]|nr:hypothetical protein [Sphingomonadaceae bacterium]